MLTSKKSKKSKAGKNAGRGYGNPWVRIMGVRTGTTNNIIRRLTSTFTSVNAQASLLKSGAAVGAQEWSSLAAIWTEYRVLAMKVHLQNGNGSAAGSVFAGTDRSAALAATNTALWVWGLENAKIFNFENTLKEFVHYEARAVDLGDQLFSPVATTVNEFTIAMFQNAGANLTFYVDYAVEFRGVQA